MLEQKIKELMEALEQDQQGNPYATGDYIYGVRVSQNCAEMHMQWSRWLKWARGCITDVTIEARRVPDTTDGSMHITAYCGNMRAVVVLNIPEMREILTAHQVVMEEIATPENYWFWVKYYECL